MSEIEEEAYSEVCEENERLRGMLKKVEVSVEKLMYCKGLCGRAAEALERVDENWPKALQSRVELIAELRKAAE